MATAAVIRARIFNNLYGAGQAKRPMAHRINEGSGYSIGDGGVAVDDGGRFHRSDVIEFQSDGMQALVELVSTHELTIMAGINGTADSDQADDAIIYKNPRFTIQQVDQAVEEMFYELETRGIFVLGTGTITLVAGQDYYDLTETDIVESVGVFNVYYADDTTKATTPLGFAYTAGYHTTISTTGHGVRLIGWGDRVAGDSVYFTYAKAIDATADLLTRQEELIVLGATARVMATDIVVRTMDPGKVTDRTIQAGQMTRDTKWFQAEYQRACWREEATLQTEIDRNTRTTKELARARRWTW